MMHLVTTKERWIYPFVTILLNRGDTDNNLNMYPQHGWTEESEVLMGW